MLSHVGRNELGDRPVSAAVVRGKELQLASTAGAARQLLARRSVKVVPVLDGRRYVGAVDRERLEQAGDEVPVGELAGDLVPVVTAETPAPKALRELDVHGGTRLVVVDEDGGAYVGIVCLRGDRRRLCLDRMHLDRHGSPP